MASASSEQNFSTGALETEQLKMDHRVTAQSPPSDNDSGERPVRQQLKETNLDAVGGNNDSARANRKRYLDNTDGANDTPPAKRSRECTPNTADSEDNSNHAELPKDATTQDNLESTAGGNEDDSSQTLKKKRSREQLEDDVSQNSHAATDPTPGLTETTSSDEKSITEGQPEKKRPRDNSEERKAKVDQTFTTSAFGKAATSPSPFAMPANKPSDASTGPASTAGFGALGSGFSAFGSAFPAPSGKLTSFASPNAPAAFPGTAGKLTSFASANAPASFSGTAGNLTSFASANAPVGFLGTAGKLTSFASPNAPVSFGEPSEKTLGAKQPDKEESDKEPAGGPDDTFVAEKTDERFHAQTVETGEENETTEFTAKGKLYYFDDKKWKERGTGTFKVNLKTEPDGKKSGRVIMRADGALRVMMNSAIWKTMPFGDIKGFRPSTRDIYLASNEDDKVVSHLLRLGNEKQAGELFDVLKDVIEEI
ncbi:Pleckstrin homology-like domain [Penicillium roqueforti FM164]|uniref:Pleckstrin homology-like domain n=1 Tax=Penicillium roqueforti (strain FM164) TaxID=1365484 RepID=W6Q013_PENRF|nr:Pleckstrin homology-like domain [Penicillium roqueforti FM164]